jgi:hypothetical protein
MTDQTLADETQFYREKKEELLRTAEGKFALIKGREILGTYDSPDRAYAEGIARLGNVPMLIVQIRRDDQPSQVPALTLGLLRVSIPS